MTNTYQNFLALRRMVFGHLRLLAIFVGVTFIVDHWRSSGGHDAAQGYDNGPVAHLASGGPAFVPLSPATLLNKMHKDASFDVGDAVSAIVQSFDDSKRGQVLESYLIWAISTERSDSYIDTLLNSAAAKGDFKVPPALALFSFQTCSKYRRRLRFSFFKVPRGNSVDPTLMKFQSAKVPSSPSPSWRP